MSEPSIVECYNRLVYASREEINQLVNCIIDRHLHISQLTLAEQIDPSLTFDVVEKQMHAAVKEVGDLVKSDLEDVIAVVSDQLSQVEVQVESATVSQLGFISAKCTIVDKNQS